MKKKEKEKKKLEMNDRKTKIMKVGPGGKQSTGTWKISGTKGEMEESLRWILGARNTAPSVGVRGELGWAKMEELITRKKLTFTNRWKKHG